MNTSTGGRTCTYTDPFNVKRCTECGQGVEFCVCVSIDNKAHDRLNSPAGIVLRMVRGELEALTPDRTQHALVSLVAEVGQLSRLMIQHDLRQETTPTEVLRRAVMVAAHTIRLAVHGDDNFLYELPMSDQDLPRAPGGKQDSREHR